MDPVSAAGLALGVAGVGIQIYTGCIQGIQLLITALNFPEEWKYLNLRLRMEQQRLFAWSETSGLLDVNAENRDKILKTNTFVLHRTTVLDLLVQVQCLFDEFRRCQEKMKNLIPSTDYNDDLETPEKDAAAANFPLPSRRRDFIKKAMRDLRAKSKGATMRLKWVSFDKMHFETLLSRFSTLNDNMTDILDARMQVEIHHTVQDTNRGVLQLHHRIADLSRLVQALSIKLEIDAPPAATTPMAEAQKALNMSGFQLLAQLAKFKAFNRSIESDRKTPWDNAAAVSLGLGNPIDQEDLQLDRSMIQIDPSVEDSDAPRCEAVLKLPGGGAKKCWIEWKDYERQRPCDTSPPKEVILGRVRKLAALLNHSPKPEAFRTPHCLGFFDKAPSNAASDEDEDILNLRLGLVFERPQDDKLHTSLPPVSLRELLQTDRRPRVTARIKLAHAISKCLLYLHAVNWLHKGLRSHNILFFRTASGHVDYDKPYLSGFDFSRPARPDEMTDVPADDAEFDLYRHPRAQSSYHLERERFKKSFDIYSLGVLFVEIAHWATVDKVLGIDINKAWGRPSVALKIQPQLLRDDNLAELGSSMGEVYEAATRKCIAGGKELGLEDGDDETDDAVAARLSMVFYENVVKKLGDVNV